MKLQVSPENMDHCVEKLADKLAEDKPKESPDQWPGDDLKEAIKKVLMEQANKLAKEDSLIKDTTFDHNSPDGKKMDGKYEP